MSHIRDETKVKILAEIKPRLWLHVTKLAVFCFVLFSRSFCIKRTNEERKKSYCHVFSMHTGKCIHCHQSHSIKVAR